MTTEQSSYSIRFRGFWPGFDPHFFFLPFVSHALGRDMRLEDDDIPVDLEIVSVFPEHKPPGPLGTLYQRYRHRVPPRLRVGRDEGPAQPNSLARVSVWYTGENVRPPLGVWDATWSFDTDPIGGTNYYLPVWMIGMDFDWIPHPQDDGEVRQRRATNANFLGRRLRSEEMLRIRSGSAGERPLFCCTFINNPEPIRMHAIEALREVGEVDVYGRASGRPVPDKASIASDYQFMLCFENDLYPGYVTEKPFEAWGAGTIPIWRGLDPAGYMNREAVIDQLQFRDLSRLAHFVEEVRHDVGWLNEVSSRPILTRAPDLLPIQNQLRHLVLD